MNDFVMIGVAVARRLKLGSRDLYLLYNGYAQTELEQMHGRSYLDVVFKDEINAQDLKVLADICFVLAIQGELARRAMGFDHVDMIERRGLEHAISVRMRLAILEAIRIGIEGQIDDHEPVDLTLIELQKKTNR